MAENLVCDVESLTEPLAAAILAGIHDKKSNVRFQSDITTQLDLGLRYVLLYRCEIDTGREGKVGGYLAECVFFSRHKNFLMRRTKFQNFFFALFS